MTKQDHTAAMHAAAEEAGLTASRGKDGWHLHTQDGQRVTPPDSKYTAQQAKAYAECWVVKPF